MPKRSRAVLLSIGLAICGLSAVLIVGDQPGSGAGSKATETRRAQDLRPGLRFEPNRGQADGAADFVSRGFGHTLYLAPDAAMLALRDGQAVRMEWLDASPALLEGVSPLESRSHYLTGAAEDWITDVPSFGEVRYRGLYPGVDLVFYGVEGGLEYDFRVAPGADPGQIAVLLSGAEDLRVEESGDLLLASAAGAIRQRKPVLYQEDGEERLPVDGRFELAGNVLRFEVGEYDRALELVIDPFIDYSTLLGRGENESVNALDVGADGSLFLAGFTSSSNFPVTGGVDVNHNGGEDVFVLKLSADGASIVFSTFLGGSSNERAMAAAVGPEGHVHVAGETCSDNFPTTVNSFQRISGGDCDAFVTKLSPAGNELVFSTYAGGDRRDWANGLAVDDTGAVYVGGGTRSRGFPVTGGALQRDYGGGDSDGFVLKLSPDGLVAEYSSYLGGEGEDVVNGLAVDFFGEATAVGMTRSNRFPVVDGAVQRQRAGGEDAFVTRLSQSGNRAVFSTYLGGRNRDVGNAVALDGAGSVYVGGFTESHDFPILGAGFGAAYGGGGDGFVAKLTMREGRLVYSSFLGGVGEDTVAAIAVDEGGYVSATGHTKSSNFPVTGILQRRISDFDGDSFWARLSDDGKSLIDSGFIGGRRRDEGFAIALGHDGAVYIGGKTRADDFPVTAAALQVGFGGKEDGFVVKIVENLELTTVSGASFAGTAPIAPGSIAASFGRNLSAQTVEANGAQLPAELGGIRVTVSDSAGFERSAAMVFVSPGQINFVVPGETSPGSATVAIKRSGQVVASGTFRVRGSAPGLFSANATGRGVAAALAVSNLADGSQITGFAFQRDSNGSPRFVPVVIAPGRQTALVLFGTGLRDANSVTVTIDGEEANVLYFGRQGEYAGLDQVNVLLDGKFAGRGLADVTVVADGLRSNPVQILLM